MIRSIKSISAALCFVLMLGASALAQSTINTGQPATDANLKSLLMRQQFTAAASDINGILAMHPATSVSNCPSVQSVGMDCLVIGSTPYVWYKWTGNTGGWAQVATINAITGVVTPALTAVNVITNYPLTSSFAAGGVTLGFSFDSNFALANNALALAPIPSGALIANAGVGSAEPTYSTLTAYLDRVLGSTNGQFAARIGGAWGGSTFGIGLGFSGSTLNLQPASGSVIGGVNSVALLANNWVQWIGTDGVPHLAQPGFANLSGSVACGQMPALTGPVTTTGGACGTAIGTAAVTYAMIQNVAAARLWGNPSGSAAPGSEISLGATLSFVGSALQTGAGTGDVAWPANGYSTTIQPAAVTFAKFQNIAALSLFGNCTNAAAVGGNVTGTANQVLRVNGAGTTCGFGAIDLSQIAAVTGTLQTASVPTFAGGDVTSTGGSLVLTIGSHAVSNGKMAQMQAKTVKMNASAGTADATDTAISSLVDIGAPSATLDWMMIEDHISGTIKRTNASELLAAAGAGVTSLNTASGAITLLTEPQGRLTLQANTPVMTVSQSNISTLRYDNYIGNQVPYFTGSADAVDYIASNEVTNAMVAAASAGQVVSGQVYDVWWVHSGANRICLAMSSATGGGGGWASDTGGSNTSRGTGYTQLDRASRPYTTNKNSIANCFNASTNYGPVAANQGTFLGTVYATANGQTSYTFGSSASGGGAALFGVWNMYNRRSTSTTVTDNGASYPYTSSTPRQARGSAGNQVTFVTGLQEDGIYFSRLETFLSTATAGANGRSGIGLNSTTTYLVNPAFAQNNLSGGQSIVPMNTTGSISLLGLSVLSANETGDNVNANTFDFSSLSSISVMLWN